MKECSTCSACFDDAARFCPNDGSHLFETLGGSRDLDGRWRLDRVVRVARPGTVYVATDLEREREAVVKTFFPIVFREPGSFDLFLEVADRLGKLDHPNAARTYAAGRLEGGGGYVVSEYFAGRTLRRALEEGGPLAVERAAAQAASLA